MARLTFDKDSDGILYGFTITYDGENIRVCAGALKYQGEVILLGEEMLPFEDFDRPVFVKIVVKPKYRTEDFDP